MIPYNTTTISVLRLPATENTDPYDPKPEPEVIASGVRAHISTGRGEERQAGGSQSIVEFRMSCDPTDITKDDQIQDENTGEVYEVMWAHQRRGIVGLEHVQCGMKQVTGVISTPFERVPRR